MSAASNFKNVLGILDDLARKIDARHKDILHERYLHHLFSHRAQSLPSPGRIHLGTTGSPRRGLHPEWPTYKRNIHVYDANGDVASLCDSAQHGLYCRDEVDKKYGSKDSVGDNGTAGHIDFAVGDFNLPDVGIEFKMGATFSTDAVAFDLMKLLDARNGIPYAVSFNVVLLRPGTDLDANELATRMEKAFTSAKRALAPKHLGRAHLYFEVVRVVPGKRDRLRYEGSTTGPWVRPT